jgi:GNAT superfamily N-acetyltransferase
MRVPVVVRAALPGDVDALVRLRLENGRVHAALDPGLYRVPDPEAVRAAFVRALSNPEGATGALLAAVARSEVVGMAEVVPRPSPPEHQILVPIATADIHIVVDPQARGTGTGTALREAAEEWALSMGIVQLVAPIHHRNAPALRFYGAAGFRDNGRLQVKAL